MRFRSAAIAGIFLFATVSVSDASQISDEIYNRGIAHYTNRNFRDAEFYLGQVLHDNPQHHIARYYLAAAMGAMGKAALARPHIEYLLQIDPQNASYKSLFDQITKVAAMQPAGKNEQSGDVRAPVQGDAYIPGVRKLTETGGGMVSLISEGVPLTPAPKLPAGYEKLQESFASNDPQIRRDAVRELIDKKDVKLISLFEWALHDQPCRELAGRGLMNLGDPGVDVLIKFARSEKDSSKLRFAYGQLGRIQSKKADAFILETFKRGETSIMPIVENALSEKGMVMLPEMISALVSKNQNVRYSSAQIISRIGEKAINPLIDVLIKQTGPVREEVVAILGGMPREKVFKAFTREQLEKLKDDSSSEISAFAESLLPPPAPPVDADEVPDIIH